MLTKGDSAVFRVAVDSVMKAGNPPMAWMQKGKNQKIEYTVTVVTVKTQSQLQAEQKEAAAKQVGIDEQLIQDYLAKNNIKAERTPSGLYYKIDNPGTGPKIAAGDSVSMNYTGKTLSGEKFDSNVDPAFNHVQPFWFNLGAGQVIRGWDEGIGLFSKGGKGTLYIPSTMAYGPQSPSQAIAPNSVLIFDVEVVDAQKTGK
jgi:FKBP-type peptidyl-prolyl cis-trans isomerase